MITFFAIITLIVGTLIGYLGQRSKMCLISGIRNVYLVRHLYLFRANVGVFLGALGSFFIYSRIGGFTPDFLHLQVVDPTTMTLSIVGGLGLGFFSLLAPVEGCPFRQFVMAGEGSRTSIFYVIGFFVGLLYFYPVISPLVMTLLALFG